MYYLLYHRSLSSRDDSLFDIITLRGIGSNIQIDEEGDQNDICWSLGDQGHPPKRWVTMKTPDRTDDRQSYETVIAQQGVLV